MGQGPSIGKTSLVYHPPRACAYLVERPPDIIVDNSLVQHSGLDYTAVLQAYMSSVVDVNQLPDYTEKLGSALGGSGLSS